MLSPVINDAKDLLTQAFNEIIALDKYSITNNNILIGKLPEDPDWLPAVRNNIAALGQEGANWILKKPEIWSSILSQFPDYYTSFQSIAQMKEEGKIKDSQWKDLLNEVLYTQLQKAVDTTQKAEAAIQAEYNKFKSYQPLLEESIQKGWAALADEEQQMMNIAEQLVKLQDTVASLESDVTSTVISDGKTITKTAVTTIYKVVTTTGSSFSYLTMVTSAFTVGKMFYDIISDTEEIDKTLEKIAELQVKASEEAQALAGTKSVLQLLYNLEKTFLTIQDVIPQIIAMWEAERDKVKIVIEGIEAGADPSTYFEIQSIPTANENWEAINQFATTIPNLIQDGGKPVTLTPQKTPEKV